ncbi:diguanylate cyclase (GGDEF) domain-containing protein [Micromonospora pallida]|uniref:Diguanylate cyclase (GGDEF) domain-containing protein n=1 Tax=Micromonospora pallida TaxID=145854 RepID=A0A1C6TBQ4_9ACTN|nr:GGDEF domain-containing protein [Micromonospora pallida]SCL39204.1 diguanylate cyclase (GGDEF) domain-containing protein [Micromonospora pallida]
MRTTLAATALGTATIGLAAGWLTAHHRLRAQLDAARHDATHDPLTGAHNRAGLTATADPLITTAHHAGRPVVVALIDLVGFKQVNDTHGHDAGDHILTTVAARLATIAGPVGIAARLGGDEFALITTGPAPRHHDADVWLNGWLPHIHARLTTPVNHHSRTLAVGATIGATLAHPDQPINVWLTTADQAMYAARARRTTTATATGPAPTTARAISRPRDRARPTSRLGTVPLAA